MTASLQNNLLPQPSRDTTATPPQSNQNADGTLPLFFPITMFHEAVNGGECSDCVSLAKRVLNIAYPLIALVNLLMLPFIALYNCCFATAVHPSPLGVNQPQPSGASSNAPVITNNSLVPQSPPRSITGTDSEDSSDDEVAEAQVQETSLTRPERAVDPEILLPVADEVAEAQVQETSLTRPERAVDPEIILPVTDEVAEAPMPGVGTLVLARGGRNPQVTQLPRLDAKAQFFFNSTVRNNLMFPTFEILRPGAPSPFVPFPLDRPQTLKAPQDVPTSTLASAATSAEEIVELNIVGTATRDENALRQGAELIRHLLINLMVNSENRKNEAFAMPLPPIPVVSDAEIEGNARDFDFGSYYARLAVSAFQRLSELKLPMDRFGSYVSSNSNNLQLKEIPLLQNDFLSEEVLELINSGATDFFVDKSNARVCEDFINDSEDDYSVNDEQEWEADEAEKAAKNLRALVDVAAQIPLPETMESQSPASIRREAQLWSEKRGKPLPKTRPAAPKSETQPFDEANGRYAALQSMPMQLEFPPKTEGPDEVQVSDALATPEISGSSVSSPNVATPRQEELAPMVFPDNLSTAQYRSIVTNAISSQKRFPSILSYTGYPKAEAIKKQAQYIWEKHIPDEGKRRFLNQLGSAAPTVVA